MYVYSTVRFLLPYTRNGCGQRRSAFSDQNVYVYDDDAKLNVRLLLGSGFAASYLPHFFRCPPMGKLCLKKIPLE